MTTLLTLPIITFLNPHTWTLSPRLLLFGHVHLSTRATLNILLRPQPILYEVAHSPTSYPHLHSPYHCQHTLSSQTFAKNSTFHSFVNHPFNPYSRFPRSIPYLSSTTTPINLETKILSIADQCSEEATETSIEVQRYSYIIIGRVDSL